MKISEKTRLFTLIELLVVIAVIAILAALLFPALKKAKDFANAAVCRNNMKQHGIAMNMFLEDNEGFLPYRRVLAHDPAVHFPATDETQSWRRALAPYITRCAPMYRYDGNLGIYVWSGDEWGNNSSANRWGDWNLLPPEMGDPALWQCPSNPKKNLVSGDGNSPISYTCNGATAVADILQLFGPDNPRRRMSPPFGPYPAYCPGPILYRMSQMQNPSQLWATVDDLGGRSELAFWTTDSTELVGRLFTRHPGRTTHYLFFDGHVEALRGSESANPINMWGWNEQRSGPAHSQLQVMLDAAMVAGN
jgi:prepilin-type processing-associated H-X9-DG protein/prepilin-type N-terminal cleavage/methylation domain-containing protein